MSCIVKSSQEEVELGRDHSLAQEVDPRLATGNMVAHPLL